MNQQRRHQVMQKRLEAEAARQAKLMEREAAAVAQKAAQNTHKALEDVNKASKKQVKPSIVIERHVVVIDEVVTERGAKNVTALGSRVRRAPKWLDDYEM